MIQEQIDALSVVPPHLGGWYQPIEFPDGSRTHSTKMSDDAFYASESKGVRKWDLVIKPNLPFPLDDKQVMEVGCNAGLFIAKALEEGADYVVGVEHLRCFTRQAHFVIQHLTPGAESRYEVRACNALTDPFHSWAEPRDIILFINSLYWMVYTSDNKFIPKHELLMMDFLLRMSKNTHHILVVGCEEKPAFGQALDSTVSLLEPFFDIDIAKKHQVNDRRLNVVRGKSKWLA